MSTAEVLGSLSRTHRSLMIGGLVLLVVGLAQRSWLLGIVGASMFAVVAWTVYSQTSATALRKPWNWPADFRSLAEGLARPIDPTPQRIVPPHARASEVAHVATTKEALSRLISEKPPAWPFAVFTSVLVQRRNGVQSRLRKVAAGYQPQAGVPLTAQAYSALAYQVMKAVADIGTQTDDFLLSPALTGALGGKPDVDAIRSAAHRLMDYHQDFLVQAETCVQTPIDGEAREFLEDMWAFTLSPLVGYERFITELCERIGEAQELIPYADGTIELDNVVLDTAPPDGDRLLARLLAHYRRFNA